MKTIALTKEKITIVDDADFDRLNEHKWNYRQNRKVGYACRLSSRASGKRRTIYMHREIMQTPEGMKTDHVNGDGCDNRRENLRTCSNAENLRNRGKQANNSSGFKGVYKSRKKWRVEIGVKRKLKHIGTFSTIDEAISAYDEAIKEIHGNFAHPNY